MPAPEASEELLHPRIIGLAPPLESLRSGKVYEFLATGRDEVGTLSKLNGVLNAHHLRLTTAGGYSVPQAGSSSGRASPTTRSRSSHRRTL